MADPRLQLEDLEEISFYGHETAPLRTGPPEDGIHRPRLTLIKFHRNQYGPYAIFNFTFANGFTKTRILNLPCEGATLQDGSDANPIREGELKRIAAAGGFPQAKLDKMSTRKHLLALIAWFMQYDKQYNCVFLGVEPDESLNDARLFFYTPEEFAQLQTGELELPKRRRPTKSDSDDSKKKDDDSGDGDDFGTEAKSEGGDGGSATSEHKGQDKEPEGGDEEDEDPFADI